MGYFVLLLNATASALAFRRYLWGAAAEGERDSHCAAAVQKAHAGKGVVLSLARLPGHATVCPQGGLQLFSVPQVLETCVATVGRVSNVDHNKRVIGKAGRNRWLGKRPHTGLWHRKGGWAGRKIKPLPPMKSYVNLPRVKAVE